MNFVRQAASNQVTILGINSLFGKMVSFLLKQSPVANKLVLYDEVDVGVAHDIAEIPTSCQVVVFNGEEQLRCAVRNSAVILIGDKDDCLANEDEAIRQKSTDIIKYATAISSIAPNAIVLVAATPVNSLLPLFTEARISCGAFDTDKVMGVTSADTMRASTLLARHMGIPPEKAYLPVIGGSSADTRIPLFSQSRPAMKANKADLKNLTREVKMAEDELKKMLGRGEALNKACATVQLMDSVMSALRGQRNISEIVLSRTCLVPDVEYFALPVILGPRGIAHRFPLPSLTERESILLDHAVKHIENDKIKGINALSGEFCVPEQPEATEKYRELIREGHQDFFGSLMHTFKRGVECPKPKMEYKLLSKVKLKLPPDATPSELPKRAKFIEPETALQDGCCPLKLPCLPIPPLRGLNQIQAKTICKKIDKAKSSTCCFPPVEKSLVPCKLCPSNNPCGDYKDFKTFYEEQSHCCTPVGESNAASDIALISAKDSPMAMNHDAENLTPANESMKGSGLATPTNGPGAEATTENSNNMILHTAWEYPKDDSTESQPKAQQLNKDQAQTSNPHNQQYESEISQLDLKAARSQQKLDEPSVPKENHSQLGGSIQPETIQHDPNLPFKCSTSLCLDILAPKNPGNETSQDTSPKYNPSNLPSVQKQDTIDDLRSSQNPLMEHNVNTNDAPSKRYNYSSGVSLKQAQKLMEGLTPDQREKDMSPGGSIQDLHQQTLHNIEGNIQSNYSSLLSEHNNEQNIVDQSSSKTINSSSKSENIKNYTGAANSKKMDDAQKKDETIKRRMYSTLEDMNSEPRSSSASGCSTETSHNNILTTAAPEENNMLTNLREKAQTITANMERQKTIRQNRRSGLGELIDAINPARRLTKSRQAAKNILRAPSKFYQNPKCLGDRGSSASLLIPKPGHEAKSLIVVEDSESSRKRTRSIERLKERIQEALKAIIYPAEIKSTEEIDKSQQRQKLETQSAIKKSSAAKQDFFVQMRKSDPAYRPTTRMYAPKCPTNLLFNDHRTATKTLTFNNVIEYVVTPEENHKSSTKDTTDSNRESFQDINNFPESILRDTSPQTIPKVHIGVGVQAKGKLEEEEHTRLYKDDVGNTAIHNQSPQGAAYSQPVRLRGDYVKHFDTQSLPKDLALSGSVIAAIKEGNRVNRVKTPATIKNQRITGTRYQMTSPNRKNHLRMFY